MNAPTIKRPWVKARKGSHDSRSHDPYYQTKEWKALRLQLLNSEPLCAECAKQGRVTPATVADHIIPREQGGSDLLSNLQGLCSSCHNKKSAKE
jgi:5-methylcytosine-specific restriction protein A